MKEELRLYSFVTFYFSSIQQGIQTGHMSDAMSVKYMWGSDGEDDSTTFIEWILNHKTYIVLNGGGFDDILDIDLTLFHLGKKLNLPTEHFSEPTRNGNIMTCAGIVVPERYFNAVFEKGNTYSGTVPKYFSKLTEGDKTNYFYYDEGTPEYTLIELIKSKPLAK